MPRNIDQVIEVPHKDNRELTYICTASEGALDIFLLDISDGLPSINHMLKQKLKIDCMCP